MIDLRPIDHSEAADALSVMDSCCRELWGLNVAEVRANCEPLEDLADPAAYYPMHGGAFLVLVDEERVIGTGAIIRRGLEIAELKRIWLLQAYRGKGLGRRMVEGLLVFARRNDYRRVCLEVATPELQQAAVGLYRRLGFREISHFREGAASLAMERNL
jgi:putative acetyltransferase